MDPSMPARRLATPPGVAPRATIPSSAFATRRRSPASAASCTASRASYTGSSGPARAACAAYTPCLPIGSSSRALVACRVPPLCLARPPLPLLRSAKAGRGGAGRGGDVRGSQPAVEAPLGPLDPPFPVPSTKAPHWGAPFRVDLGSSCSC